MSPPAGSQADPFTVPDLSTNLTYRVADSAGMSIILEEPYERHPLYSDIPEEIKQIHKFTRVYGLRL